MLENMSLRNDIIKTEKEIAFLRNRIDAAERVINGLLGDSST